MTTNESMFSPVKNGVANWNDALGLLSTRRGFTECLHGQLAIIARKRLSHVRYNAVFSFSVLLACSIPPKTPTRRPLRRPP